MPNARLPSVDQLSSCIVKIQHKALENINKLQKTFQVRIPVLYFFLSTWESYFKRLPFLLNLICREKKKGSSFSIHRGSTGEHLQRLLKETVWRLKSIGHSLVTKLYKKHTAWMEWSVLGAIMLCFSLSEGVQGNQENIAREMKI